MYTHIYKQFNFPNSITLLSFTFFDDAADWYHIVPFSIVTGKKLIVSLHNVTIVTEILYHCAMRKPSAWGGVASITSIFWLIWRLAYYPWK